MTAALSLVDHLEQHTTPDDADDRERFTVDNDRKAEWAAAKLRRAQQQADEVKAQADEQRRLIDTWVDEQTGPLQSDVDYFTGLLVDYLRRRHDDDPDVKSIKLPSATVQSRAGRDKVDVTDSDTFGKWHADHRTYALAQERVVPDKRALAALTSTSDGHLVTEDGEVVPGVGVTPGSRSYSVKVNR